MQYGDYRISFPGLTPGVKLLLLVNAGVFLLNALLQGSLSIWLALSWSGLWEGYGLGLVRLVTYQFVHSFGDPWHILMNMLVLYFLGTFVEGSIGRRRLLRLYVSSGVVGGLVQLLLGTFLGVPDQVVIGASGAVYGIMVYAACIAPRMRIIFIVFPIELRWLVALLVGLGAYYTYVQLVTGAPGGVAHGAHLGGALWGFVAHRMAGRWGRLDVAGPLRRWLDERRRREHRRKMETFDKLLEKVHREGMNSLSPAERRFMNKISSEMRRK